MRREERARLYRRRAVRPEAGRVQAEREPGRVQRGHVRSGRERPGVGGKRRSPDGRDSGATPGPPSRAPPRRFFGAIRLDPDRAGRGMGTVAEEVLQHLTTLPGAEVEVSVEISAKVPDGVSRTVRRIVEENCRTLRLRAHGFEEE